VLPPDARAVLTDALKPPSGARLERAVALTFTLSLESALVAPLAFAAGALSNESDQLSIMEAVRGSADRIDIFCQAGQIVIPERGGDLLAFLEPMVHPVRRPRPGRLFHPKLWALRYRDDEDSGYARLLVLSRNLTPDQSWDACLRLDGTVGTRRRAANRPIVDVIRRARELAVEPMPDERGLALDGLLEDLRRVDWDLPEHVTDLAFHAFGIPGGTVPDFDGTRRLVVSPFCNPAGLARIAPEASDILIGRQEELDRLPDAEVAGRQIHVVSELAGLHTTESEQSPSLLTGLHAKLYVIEKGHSARLLIGSANATDAAFGGNVELLVELAGSRNKLGIDTLVGADAPLRTILEPYHRQPPVEPDEVQERLEDLVRTVAAVPLVAQAERRGDTFTLHLTSEQPLPNPPDGVRLTAELLTRRGEAAELPAAGTVDVQFGDLELAQVTPFVILTAADTDGRLEARTVVRAQLLGDPAGRLDEIIARQVDTPEKFLRFLALLLGGDFANAFGPAGAAAGGGERWTAFVGPGIFELLLTALADRPAQLDDLGRLVERLEATEHGQVLLPDGFTELWKTVEQAHQGEPA
jgi:hypothetical protein